MKNKIKGVLYGMAIGDAMGMPPELWSRAHLIERYGVIEDFLDGPADNEISYQYKRGQFTDDTAQALVILDSLIESHFVPKPDSIATHILDWAKRENAFEMNILGPTSKATLEAFSRGEDARKYSDAALSNGAAMRIAPVGVLFHIKDKLALCDYVKEVSKITHSSDITLTGASMIAVAVSAVMSGCDRETMIDEVLSIESYAMAMGASTVSASMGARIRYGVDLAHKYANDSNAFLGALYDMFGATVNTVDSVPCAIAIAYYAWDVRTCALMCANLGGDTDTIGAMAGGICGAIDGISGIATDDISLMDKANAPIDFDYYAIKLEEMRGKC